MTTPQSTGEQPPVGGRRPLRPRLWIPLLAMLVFAGIVVTPAANFVWYFVSEQRAITRQQRRMLYEVNHQAILDACRAMLADPQRFPRDREVYLGDTTDPQVTALPAVLRDLNPVWLEVRGDEVIMEFGGGFYHYGLQAYATDTQTCAKTYLGPCHRLLPGLWYYAENGYVPARR